MAGDGYGDPRALIARDGPLMRDPNVSLYECCGVHFPELPRWFLTGRA